MIETAKAAYQINFLARITPSLSDPDLIWCLLHCISCVNVNECTNCHSITCHSKQRLIYTKFGISKDI